VSWRAADIYEINGYRYNNESTIIGQVSEGLSAVRASVLPDEDIRVGMRSALRRGWQINIDGHTDLSDQSLLIRQI
jgi:hypothetical protein